MAADPLALVNVTFLVANADLAVEDLLIKLPVLQHFGVDTETLSEERRDFLDDSDCSSITPGTRSGQVGRFMIARLNPVPNSSVLDDKSLDNDRPRVHFYKVRKEEDPFLDTSLLDAVDSSQSDEIKYSIEDMIQVAIENGFPIAHRTDLEKLFFDHTGIFRASSSSGPRAELISLKVDLVFDVRPVRVRLRKYSPEQRQLLSDMVNKLVDKGLAYSNPSSLLACAPLLVPKSSSAKFRFTVDLRPVNGFTVKHQFPMPIAEQELTKIARSVF